MYLCQIQLKNVNSPKPISVEFRDAESAQSQIWKLQNIQPS